MEICAYVFEMSPKPWKRKHRKSGNNQKVSPEIKKQKTLVDFTCSDKGIHSLKMAEKLCANKGKTKTDSVTSNSNIEAKLDFIIEKIKPIDEMSQNMKMLTEKFATLEKRVGEQESRINDVEKSLEISNATIVKVKTDLHTLSEETKSKGGECYNNNLWKVRCDSLESSLTRLEEYSRRENIIFEGLKESQNENCFEVIFDLLTEKLLIQDARKRIQFSRVHRVGKKKTLTFAGAVSEHPKPRPIIARVINYAHKEEIMSRRSLLSSKASNEQLEEGSTHKIWINHDYTDNVRLARRILAPVLKIAKQKDKDSYITGDKLYYKGQKYSLDEISKLDLDTAALSMVMSGEHVAFYGRFSPLSNFHPAVFDIEGVTYNCVEQYYQAQRAIFAKRRDIVQKILLAKDPVNMKSLGDQLKSSNTEWYTTQAVQVMRTGLSAKFSKPYFKQFLFRTEQRRIIEANKYDQFWSCGLSSSDPKIKDINKWPGKNQLGKLLMELRSNL